MLTQEDKNYLGEMFEKQIQQLKDRLDETFATKQDLNGLEVRMDDKMEKQVETIVGAVDVVMEKRLTSLRKEIKHDMNDLRGNLYVEIKNKIAEHVATHHA